METLELEKVLIFENQEEIEGIDRKASYHLPTVAALYATFKALDIADHPSLSDVVGTAYDPEKRVRGILADKTGYQVNGIKINREAMAQMVELPGNTQEFIQAARQYNATAHHINLSHYLVEAGRVVLNTTAIAADQERWRVYATTPEELDRLERIKAFADAANALSKEFSNAFTDQEIPLLAGKLFERDGKIVGSYKFNYQFIKTKNL